MHRVVPHLALLIALFWGLTCAPAFAQRKKPTPGIVPPQPVQLNVKIRREGKTEIPLTIHGVANAPLKFLIRNPPQSGKVSEPRQTGKETAVTVYEPPADLGVTTDRFLYAVQSNAGVSAPVEVFITIVDQPAELKIPDSLEFGTVRSGDTATKYLEFSNAGGSMATGEVVVEAPWRIEGKGAYSLGAGEIAVFKLIFAPASGGKFEKVARFTSDPAHSTVLRGMGETSVTASPPEVVLQNTTDDPARRGTLTLINQTDEPRHLELKGGERLKVEQKVSLPPRGKVEVSVEVAAADVRALQAEIQVVAPDFELRVPVTAAAPGPIIRVTPPAIVFGRIPIKPIGSVRFEVENIGGAPGEVVWTIAPPFRTSQNSALLIPGEKRAYDLEIEAKNIGLFRTQLQYKAGAQTLEIPVEAEIQAVAPAGKPRSPTPGTGDEGLDSVPAVAGSKPVERITAPSVPDDWFGDIKLPPGVRARPLSATTVSIEWPVILSPAERFRFELRQFQQGGQGELSVAWLELPGIEVKRQGEQYSAVIRDLEPRQPWVVRVLPVRVDGTPEARLFAVDFKTPAKRSFLPRFTVMNALWIVLISLGIWRMVMWWRNRRGPAT